MTDEAMLAAIAALLTPRDMFVISRECRYDIEGAPEVRWTVTVLQQTFHLNVDGPPAQASGATPEEMIEAFKRQLEECAACEVYERKRRVVQLRQELAKLEGEC